MSEKDLRLNVFAPGVLPNKVNMDEVAKYLDALPNLPAIGGYDYDIIKDNNYLSDDSSSLNNTIDHPDTLDLIILLGEITAASSKEAKDKFVACLETLLAISSKKNFSKIPFRKRQDIRMNCQITLSKYS